MGCDGGDGNTGIIGALGALDFELGVLQTQLSCIKEIMVDSDDLRDCQ